MKILTNFAELKNTQFKCVPLPPVRTEWIQEINVFAYFFLVSHKKKMPIGHVYLRTCKLIQSFCIFCSWIFLPLICLFVCGISSIQFYLHTRTEMTPQDPLWYDTNVALRTLRNTDNFKYPIWVCVIPSQNSIYQTRVHRVETAATTGTCIDPDRCEDVFVGWHVSYWNAFMLWKPLLVYVYSNHTWLCCSWRACRVMFMYLFPSKEILLTQW